MEVLILENKTDSEKDRCLRQKAALVKNINDEIRQMAQKMIEVMQNGKGVGLAGPQVGFPKRIFVTNADEAPRVFINPSITWTSQEQVNFEEGCLSLPGMYAEIKRPGQIKVQAWNENGRVFTIEASGLLARVIQHEYDHLEGILLFDRVNETRRNKLLAKLAKRSPARAKKRIKTG